MQESTTAERSIDQPFSGWQTNAFFVRGIIIADGIIGG